MKHYIALTLLFSALPTLAAVPNTFSAGTPAKAAEVNANFNALDTDIQANTTATQNNNSAISSNTAAIQSNASTITSNSQNILTNTTAINTTNIDIQANSASITSLENQAQISSADILANSNAISSNAAEVQINSQSIIDIEADVLAHQNQITNLEDDVLPTTIPYTFTYSKKIASPGTVVDGPGSTIGYSIYTFDFIELSSGEKYKVTFPGLSTTGSQFPVQTTYSTKLNNTGQSIMIDEFEANIDSSTYREYHSHYTETLVRGTITIRVGETNVQLPDLSFGQLSHGAQNDYYDFSLNYDYSTIADHAPYIQFLDDAIDYITITKL